MITEVKLKDLEKPYKDLAFRQRMDFQFGGNWEEDINPATLRDRRERAESTLTDDWNSLLTAATVGDEENGKTKINYVTFLIRGVKSGQILVSDVYKYKEYLEIFERNKNRFTDKDLGQYKDRGDYNYFATQALRIKQAEEDDPSSQRNVEKAKKYKDLLVMKHAGYSMYMIPQQDDMEKDVKFYYNASCELGSGTQWCTATGNTQSWFDQYSQEGPLFIFLPDSGRLKFQYSPTKGEFMNSNDQSVYNNPQSLSIIEDWEPFFDKIGELDKNHFDLILQMVTKADERDVKYTFDYYFTTDKDYIDRVFELGPQNFLEEAEAGNWDNDKTVQTWFSREQLDPYNHNNWLKLLAKGPQTYLYLTYPENFKELLGTLMKDYRLGTLEGVDYKIIQPYEGVFFESVVKPALEDYLEGNTIKFNYEGQLDQMLRDY